MKKRLWWSMLLSSAALLVTSVTAFADRPGVGTPGPGGTAPGTIQQIPTRVPASTGTGANQVFKAWEGLNSSTYLNPVFRPETPNFADIAVGPADIVTVVDYNIVRYPNPNTLVAAGTTSLLTSAKAFNDIIRNQQSGVAVGGYMEPRRQSLDRWLGPTILGHLCPTVPRTENSCVISDATVRYDQLQGRFLVLMNVVDTGLIVVGGNDQLLLQQARKASWVLAVSKYSTFKLGTNPSDLFTPATPGSGTVLGGISTDNWYFYYGSAVAAIGGDGFGSPNISTGVTGIQASTGNINAIPGIGGSNLLTTVIPGAAAAATLFNCSAPLPTDGSVCYFPTAARLGVDNDDVIIASPVVNTNWTGPWEFAGTRVRVLKKVAIYNGAAPLGAGNQFTPTSSDYYDLYATRPYNQNGSNAVGLPIPNVTAGPNYGQSPYTIAPGYGQVPFMFATLSNLPQAIAATAYTATIAAQYGALQAPIPPATAGVYVYQVVGLPAPLTWTTAADNTISITGTAPAAGVYPITVTATDNLNRLITAVYTLTVVAANPAGASGAVPGPTQWWNNPAFCEPQWLRGRPAASFSNALIGTYSNTPAGSSQSYIECIRTLGNTSSIWVQPIQYTTAGVGTQNPPSNTRPGIQFFPSLIGDGTVVGNPNLGSYTGTPTAQGLPGMQQAFTEIFGDPNVVGQKGSVDGTVTDLTAPSLNVGDARPQKVVFREGHLYDARALSTWGNAFTLSSNPMQFTTRATLAGAVEGSAYSNSIGVTGGTAGYSCNAVGLPAGIFFAPNPSNGRNTCNLTGTPAAGTAGPAPQQVAGQTYAVAVVVTDARGGTMGPAMFTLNVKPAGVAAASAGGAIPVAPTMAPPLSTVGYDILQKILPVGCTTPTCSPIGWPAQNINRVFNNQWYNASVYAPMYDVPANVTLSGTASSSPINFLPWVEKLFVATTYPALSATDPRLISNGASAAGWGQAADRCTGNVPGVDSSVPSVSGAFSWSGLFDIRCGQDTFDYFGYYRNPVTGVKSGQYTLATRGGAAIDPNNGSLWNFGLYSNFRDQTIPGAGQWGTYAANYDLSFPQVDPYGNTVMNYSDVAAPTCNANCTSVVPDQTYIAVQVMKNVGVIAAPTSLTGANSTVRPSNVAGAAGDVNTQVARIELAKYVATSLMDETGITAYLNATGGCYNSFADVDPGCNVGSTVTNASGLLTYGGGKYSGGWRYSELLYRRGISVGSSGSGVDRLFAPNDLMTRAHISVFIIRAKMNNVFPTSLNGCPVLSTGPACTAQSADNFALFQSATPYFSDVIQDAAGTLWFPFVQKLYELRISNGTAVPTFNLDGTIAAPGTYGINDQLTRGQTLVMLARAFFY